MVGQGMNQSRSAKVAGAKTTAVILSMPVTTEQNSAVTTTAESAAAT